MKKEKQEERRDLTNKSRDEKKEESIVLEWNLGMHDPCLILTKCFVLIES